MTTPARCEARCIHDRQCEAETGDLSGQHWMWTDRDDLHVWTSSKPCDQEEQR